MAAPGFGKDGLAVNAVDFECLDRDTARIRAGAFDSVDAEVHSEKHIVPSDSRNTRLGTDESDLTAPEAPDSSAREKRINVVWMFTIALA